MGGLWATRSWGPPLSLGRLLRVPSWFRGLFAPKLLILFFWIFPRNLISAQKQDTRCKSAENNISPC